MIKLEGLHKYFNKGSSTEIHVINDISLTLKESGLVVLLGPSGSGKTTLLNVIGGLDNVKKGSITFDDVMINKYKSKTWDNIRNQKVGYVFQNYNLFNDLSVGDNVSFVIRMLGITDQNEIDKRVEYVLEAVGLSKFVKRKTSRLSGGQQQRVAIARALAKNPNVIIADEPTGNLDSKNTNQIMQILKSISKTKLVVLVTHEETIANFYSDRVIRLSDGEIVSDKTNVKSGSLDVRSDNDIYLQDMKKEDVVINNGNVKLSIYKDAITDEDQIDIKLIYSNGRLFVDTNSSNNQTLRYISDSSDINILDAKYEDLTSSTDFETEYDVSTICDDSLRTDKRVSVISNKESLKIAWRKMILSSKKEKMLYLVYAVCGAIVATCIALLGEVYTIDDSQFMIFPKDYVSIEVTECKNNVCDEKVTIEEIIELENQGIIDGFSPDFSLILSGISYSEYDDSEYEDSDIFPLSDETVVTEIGLLKSKQLIKGRMPENDFEVVIDKIIINNKSAQYNYVYDSYNDYLNSYIDSDYKIVGIVDTGANSIYVSDNVYPNFIHVLNVKVVPSDIVMIYGRIPTSDDEVILPSYSSLLEEDAIFQMEGSSFINITGLQPNSTYVNLKVVGFYDDPMNGFGEKLVTVDGMKLLSSYSSVDAGKTYLNVYSTNTDNLIDELETRDFDYEVTYDVLYHNYKTEKVKDAKKLIIATSVVLVVIGLSFAFIVRSSLMSRIYEISVYRSLGVTKWDVIKIFAIEIILLTTLSTIIGYVGTLFFLNSIQKPIDDYLKIFEFQFWNVGLGLIFIYGVNLFSGLLPVNLLVRKTPAAILSKYEL